MQTWRLEDFYSALCVKGVHAFLASQTGVAMLNLLESEKLQKVNGSSACALAVTASLDLANNNERVVEVWREERQVWSGQAHARDVATLGWNHQDNLLASGSSDSMILIWDTRKTDPVIRLNTPEGVGVQCLVWNHERPTVLAAAHDTAIKLWDVRFPMKSLATAKRAHGSRIVSMHWHPTNPSYLLTAGKLATLRVWNITQVKISQLYHKEVRSVTSAKFTPYGDSVLYAPSLNELKPTVLALGDDMKVIGQLTGFRSHLLDFEFLQIQGKWYVVGLGGDHSLIQLECPDESKDPHFESPSTEFHSAEPASCASFEEELSQIEKQQSRAGIVIEDKGLVRRYCVVKLSNDVHSLRLDVSVPRDYPAQPPTFRVLDSSLLTPAQLSDICAQLEELASRRSQKKRACLQEALLLVSRLLSNFEVVEEPLLNLNDSWGDEGSDGAAEESTRYPASCGHCWHPSGRFVFFACYDMAEVHAEADDCYVYVKERRAFRPDVGINSGEYEQNPASLMYYDPTITTKPTRRSTTCVSDFSDFMPLNRAFCSDLKLVAQDDLLSMCERNAEVCRKHSRAELFKCWRVLAHAWRLFKKGAEKVMLHPLGVPLVLRMVDHFLKQNEETSATLLCLYVACQLNQYLVANGDPAVILRAKAESEEESGEALLSLLACSTGLAALLGRWGSYLQRTQVLKLLARVNTSVGWETSPQSLGYVCELSDKVDYLLSLEDSGSLVECPDCKSVSFACVVCQQAVKGLAVVCRECGHGGHVKHIKKWFGLESTCAAGCGCQCQTQL